jgi:hypothetical protein
VVSCCVACSLKVALQSMYKRIRVLESDGVRLAEPVIEPIAPYKSGYRHMQHHAAPLSPRSLLASAFQGY